MRGYGCTRLQIGIQHTDNRILSKINRGCTNEDAVLAVRLLKNCGFKIDFHLMPDLPGSTVECDKEMIDYILRSDELQADQWKLYPTQTVPWTVIKKWNESGQYSPYPQRDLVALMIWIKASVPPWIRLNRVIRDIPEHYISAGNPVTNLRQTLLRKMKEKGLKCKCIRCREVGAFFRDSNENENEQNVDVDAEIVIKERKYKSSGGDEIFISFERRDEAYIYGFVRLRLPLFDRKYAKEFEEIYDSFPELKGAALVRELHVYGQMIKVGEKKQKNDKSKLYAQHYGFGSKLMRRAEEIAMMRGYERIAVIAGIGTRTYYKKLGYHLEGTYMLKMLRRNSFWHWVNDKKWIIAAGIIVCASASYLVHRRNVDSKHEK